MSRLLALARTRGLDALIVVAAAESVLEVAVRRNAVSPAGMPRWVAAPAVGLLVLLLLGRRRFPFAAPAALWLVAAALSFVDGRVVTSPSLLQVAGMAAAALLGNLRDDRQVRLGLVVVVGGGTIVGYHQPGRDLSSVLFLPLLFFLAWLAGYAMRERAEQAHAAELRATLAEQERDVATRIAVAEERARIAREMHDVVAHAVSVMVLQVGAVRHRLPAERGRDRAALHDVERAGRTALAEMRTLLSAMRQGGDELELAPQPRLDSIDGLLDDVRRAGLAVRLHVVGQPVPLPQAIEVSAYRIVQEGLTNALKHASARHADVTVHYDADRLRIQVRDDGRGATSSDGLGSGLAGIRERVIIYGGEMTAGAVGSGGFALTTSLPLDRTRP